jgi:hypothetical protein
MQFVGKIIKKGFRQANGKDFFENKKEFSKSTASL